MKKLKSIFTSSKKPLAAVLFSFVGLFSLVSNTHADANKAVLEEKFKNIGHVAKRFKHKVPYDGSMVLINKSEKRLGREILKDPNNQKEVCVGFTNDSLRFGYVDGSVCRVPYGGAKDISMSGQDAAYVHFPEGGEWIDLNQIKEEDEQALIGNHPGHRQSKASLAYIPEHQAIGGRFFSHSKNIHYGIPGHEKHVLGNQARQKGVKVFIPKASQNPFHEFDLHQDMRLIEQGKEKGIDIVKSPNGNKIACIGHHADKRVVRFGWADGNFCRIASGGHQAIPFAKNDHSYKGRAYYFTFRNGGRWVKNAQEAEKTGDGEHPLIATAANTLDKHHGQSWAGLAYDESRDVTGGYYLGYGARLPHFLDPRSMKEVSNRNYAQIHVYVPNVKVNAMHQIFQSPYMQLMKKGQENGRAVLKSPDGLREVCVGVHRRGPHNMRFGWVDGSVCRIGSWGAQSISLDGKDGYLVHFPFGGQWIKPENRFQYATPQLVDPLLGAHGGINGHNHDSCSGLAYHESKKGIGGNYFGGVDSNKNHNFSFVNSQNMREENERDGNKFFQFIPYRMPIEQMFKIDDRIELIPYGKHKGKEGELLKGPKGQSVCATIIEFDPFNVRHTEKIISTGFEKDGICYNEAWGPRSTPMANGVYYIKSKTGSKVWKSFKAFGNDAVKANIFHKNEFSHFTNAISAKGEVVGRSHPPSVGITAINASKGAINSGTPDDILLFDPDGKEAPPALDISKLQSHAKVAFVKYGEHSGKEADLLKDPSGKYVCMMHHPVHKQIYFGHEKGGKCHGEAWGKQSLDMNGLHYVKAKGSWKKLSELSGDQFAETTIVKKDGVVSAWLTGIGSRDGHASKTHPTDEKLWGVDKNGKVYVGFSLRDNAARVFVPGDDKPALDISKLQSHPKVEFVKHGEHSGIEADLLKDPSGKYVCMMHHKDQKQVYFGHEKDGKCHGEAWGAQHLPMNGLHYVKAKGSWKKLSELSGDQFAETTIVKKDGVVSSWLTGIGSRDGHASKTHPTDEKLWGVDKNGKVYTGFSLRDNAARVFVPGEDKPALDISKLQSHPKVEFVKHGEHSGIEADLLKDPSGKYVCMMHHKDQKQVYFGHEKDGKCHGEAWGAQHLPMNGLHYVKAKGSWKKLSELSGDQFAETTIVKKDGVVSSWLTGIGSRDGHASKTHPTDEKLWGVDKNGKVYTGFSLRDNAARVFVPGEDKPALDISKLQSHPKVEFVKHGEHSGIEADLLKDPSGKYVCMMHHKDQKQVYFGHEKDGKCHGEAWGAQHLPMNGLHYVKAKGSWKKLSELSGDQFAETTIVKKDGVVSSWLTGIGSRDGHASKTHPTDEKLWGVDKNGKVYTGFSLRDNAARVFVPGEDKLKAEETKKEPATSDSSSSSELPSDFDGLVYISLYTDLQNASSGISGDAEKKKWGEKHYIDFGKKEGREYKNSVDAKEDVINSYDSASSNASESTTAKRSTEEKKEERSILYTQAIPDLAGKEVLAMTTEQIVGEIEQGKMIASDPDSAVLLEQQPAVDLLGEPYAWVRLGRGFAMDPVELSPHNGVICRFLEQGTMYIGNLYKNKFESPQAKIGDIICRAATNLDNLVYLTKNFETLSAREGALPLWQPMIVVQPENWETGYRTINVGQTVTENDKTFKVYGVCRTQKEKNPAHYHIGRAEVDEAGQKHCFMKKGGKQQDWTGDDLNQVEVLARGTALNNKA